MPDVIIIGAGVVGLSAAIAAQSRGLSVMVLDKVGPAAGASAGNAGAFAFSDILPLASPGLLRKAPRWLLDPLGPLTIPPAYLVRIAPWLYRFWRSCAPAKVASSTAAQTSLMDLSRVELNGFLEATGTAAMLRRDGNLQVYESDSEFRDSLPGWSVRERHGIAFQHMTADEMSELQPGLSSRFVRGTFSPEWYTIADPKLFTLSLADHFIRRGGVIETAEVIDLRSAASGVAAWSTDGRRFETKQLVVAAGAFSHRLARTMGDRIPLEAERGYNTTLPPDAFDLRRQITFGGHGFVVSRLSTGIRVGGAVELGGLDRPPNFRRSDVMLKKAQVFLPGLRTIGGSQWMGLRPSLPDSLPAIGRASANHNVFYAFGHGHLGLTQMSGTARIVADLLTGRPSAIDLAPFLPQRF